MTRRNLAIVISMMAVLAPVLTTRARAEDLVGTGEWVSVTGGPGIRGTWSARLARAGERISGTMQLTGSTILTGGDVSGTISGDDIALGFLATDGQIPITFAGRLSRGKISGEWTSPAVKDDGVWSGTLVPDESPSAHDAPQ